MQGIDISAYQLNLDFSKIKAQIVYIKATEGLTYTNPLLKLQYQKAKAKGLKIGFYHFLRTNNPIDEANHFLWAIAGLESDCKYAIDVETDAVGASLRVRKFADYLISQKKEPCIYTGLYFYNNNLDYTVKDLPLWIAYYNKNRPNIKSVGWQYSDSQIIGSIPVDHNIFDVGILLNKEVKTVSNNYNKIILLQKVCNRVGIRGANGKPLVEDGLNGTNTTAAKIKLKAYIAAVTK